MRQVLLYFYMAIFFVGCSNGDKTINYNIILENFNSDLLALNKPILNFSETQIQEVDLESSVNAKCYSKGIRTGGVVVIGVNKNTFGSIPYYAQTAILYHEIGHCFYGLDHVATGKVLMTGNSVWATFQENDIIDSSKRLGYLKQMVESAP